MYAYGELREFYQANGHCRVPFAQGKLGIWVLKQRQAYRQGKITEDSDRSNNLDAKSASTSKKQTTKVLDDQATLKLKVLD